MNATQLREAQVKGISARGKFLSFVKWKVKWDAQQQVFLKAKRIPFLVSNFCEKYSYRKHFLIEK